MLEEAGSRLVLVDFFAEWCGPCKKIGPILQQLATKHRPKPGDDSSGVLFCKVDVDKSRELAQARSNPWPATRPASASSVYKPLLPRRSRPHEPLGLARQSSPAAWLHSKNNPAREHRLAGP